MKSAPKQRLILLAVLFSLQLFPSAGLACRCGPRSPTPMALERATAVFSGRVIAIEPNGAHLVTVTILARTVWKGDVEKELRVTTIKSSNACGFPFRKGEEYLIYAKMSGMGEDQRLSTHLCSRTKRLAEAKDDLIELGVGTPVASFSP